MRLQDKVFRWVTHWFYEIHPCASYTWFHKGYEYKISRVKETDGLLSTYHSRTERKEE